jgi:phosphoglycerate dehydrogenase-like enzyme
MKILILSPIDPEAIDQLRRKHEVLCAYKITAEQLATLIRDQEVLVFRSGVEITADLMHRARSLKLLVRAGSGLDNVDVAYVRGRGLRLVRIPQPGAKAVAELTFALMLALARQLVLADRMLRAGHWAKHELTGYLLTGKVLGIVGAGNIGSRVGQLGVAWGMKVIGCVEQPGPTVAAKLAEKGIRLTDFDSVMSLSDFVSVHTPLKESTRNLIDAAALSRMKPGSFLTNLARGGVVDEQALYRELVAKGRLAGAALDVHAQEGEGKISPLAGLPNVLLTPHIGASTVDTQREIGLRVVSVINRFSCQQEATAETCLTTFHDSGTDAVPRTAPEDTAPT